MSPIESGDDTSVETRPTNFIRAIIDEDLANQRHDTVVTRFPPEPNGYLHIGHAKSICLNFGLARDYQGQCHLRFDDTNPLKEDTEYVESIKEDVAWLGFDWGDNLHFASDYFEQMYAWAQELIRKGLAYVDSLTLEETRALRGSLSEPGKPSPYRERSVEENLDLFARMRAGEFEEGAHTLRAKIDMSSSNMLMRDPLLYRIRHATHHRTGDDWCIYPMYDYAHCLEDAIEGITHSICTLEFENNRELYDWVLDNVSVPARPHQYEFARLGLGYTVMSKRKLLHLVNEGHVSGWDDPRMPTIAGLRRRGVTPEAIRAFCDMIGVAKTNSLVDIEKLEYNIRNDLNTRAKRVMCVLDPLLVTLTNFDEPRDIDAASFPHDIGKEGSRPLPLSKHVWIERTDFMAEPTKGFRRLRPGGTVRLRHAGLITCDEVIRDEDGLVTELVCTFHEEGEGPEANATIHWVSQERALDATVRLYDRLFAVERPDADPNVSFLEHLNPESLQLIEGAKIEPSVGTAEPGTRYQFERQGYFVIDTKDSSPDALVFNRIVALRSSWGSKKKASQPAPPKPKAASTATSGRVRPPKRTRAEEREIYRERNPKMAEAFERFQTKWGLSREDADVMTGDTTLATFFEASAALYDNIESVTNWVRNEVVRVLKDASLEETKLTPESVTKLAKLQDDGVVSSSAARTIFETLVTSGGDPESLIDELGLRQMDDSDALSSMIDEILAANPDKVARYRDGNKGLLGFFMGQIMRSSNGTANPQTTRELLSQKLG